MMPVPPGTALHQLYSVPPTGRVAGSGSGWSGLWSDIIDERKSKRIGYRNSKCDRSFALSPKQTALQVATHKTLHPFLRFLRLELKSASKLAHLATATAEKKQRGVVLAPGQTF